MSDNYDERDDETTDPSQLIPPTVESGMKVRGYRARNLWYGAPGVALCAGAAGTAVLGDLGTATSLGAVGATTAAGGVAFASGSDENTTGLDRVRAPVRARRQKHETPISHDELASGPVHGVRRIEADGTVEMADGRLVAFIRLDGRNSDLETDEQRQSMVSALSNRADERLGDHGFRYYSTTTAFDPAEVADRFRSEAYGTAYGGPRWKYARELLLDFGNWYENTESERWDARHWQHYVIVEVAPWEVDVPSRGGDDGLASGLVDQLTGRSSGSDAATDRERRVSRMQRELRKRTATVAGRVFGPTPGIDTEQADAGEVALLLSRHWSGTGHAFASAAERDSGGFDSDFLADALSAPSYGPADDYMRVGRQYVRTYWVSDWPVSPDASFLRELATTRGVDVDVTLRVKYLDKDDVQHQLKNKLAELDADIEEREEQTDLSSLTVTDDMESYVAAYMILHKTDVRPWDLNGYVTVRAGDRDALDKAEQAIADEVETADTVSLDVERARALEDTADSVVETAEETPAKLTLLSPDTRQRDLFESACPAGRDVYDRVSFRDRSRTALGGVIGALCPAISATYRDENGIPWGRSMQNGSEVVADPFDVGGPAHGLFIGDSGSGKTYSVVLRAIRWWLADPDRTLVLAGPFGDLSGLVDVLDGQQLVVGGTQTINPLAISPASDHARDQGVDAVGSKVSELSAFLSGVLREQGVDPGPYSTAIKSAAYEVYARAGIYPNDPESQETNESPVMDDYRDVLAEMAEQPEQEAYSSSNVEVTEVEEKAGILLRKLSGFQAGREYEHFAGRNEFGIREGGLSYVDLQQLESLGAVGKSAALQMVLSRVYETVKSAGETLFLLDEAHYLLHNEETLEWLQRATRHWRHHNGGLWLSSQRPDEFVNLGETDGENHHETIRAQCTIKQITNLDGLDDDVAEKFGLNHRQASFAEERATRGDDGLGYSEALLSFDDMEGWLRTQVRASPFENVLLSHEPSDDEHPPIREYIRREYGEVTA